MQEAEATGDRRHGRVTSPENWELVREEGVDPFHPTKLEFKDEQGRHIVWEARPHRKTEYYRVHGEPEPEAVVCPYAPHRFAWWIGLSFALGSLMFLTTSIWLVSVDGIDYPFFVATIMPLYVVGGVLYLVGAYLMVLEMMEGSQQIQPLGVVQQRSKGDEAPSNYCCVFRPKSIDWWASYSIFLGSIVFKVSLLWLFFSPLWFAHIRTYYVLDNIWFLIGTIGFVAGSYLQYVEVVHSWFGVQWNFEFWVVTLNLLGSILFMATAIIGIATSQVALYYTYLYQGTFGLAVLFFMIGGYLQMVEAEKERIEHKQQDREQKQEQKQQVDEGGQQPQQQQPARAVLPA